MSKVALVIPWFGPDLKGGAEQIAWQISTRLAGRGHEVEVLTTCCGSFLDDWGTNRLPEGATRESGVTVRRFRVAPRDRAAFDAANRVLLTWNDRPKLAGVPPVPAEVADNFVRQNIQSPAMMEYLEHRGADFRAVLFLPYLYGPILLGIHRVADRAYLQPCLHDETYAYLPQVASAVHAASGLLFNSEGEALLAQRLFGPGICSKGVVVGTGVEIGEDVGFLSPPGVPGGGEDAEARPYLLCLARRDPTKNTDFLMAAFVRLREKRPNLPLRLILAGPGDLPRGGKAHPDLVDAGLVSEAEKARLLRGCLALVQPSRNESFSRSMVEAWRLGKPVLVHGACLATASAVEASGGGWTASTQEEWGEAMERIVGSPRSELERLGERGRAYAQRIADWEAVLDRMEGALRLTCTPPPPVTRRTPCSPRAIHQLLPNLAYGDAISNQALFLRDTLRALGHESEIYVRYLEDRMRSEGEVVDAHSIGEKDVLLYHHSIGSPLTPLAVRHLGPKALLYHNVTPAKFYEPWDPDFAKLLRRGREDLEALGEAFPTSVGDSAFNAEELAQAGFREPGVLPIVVDPFQWDEPADPVWMERLQDGATNLLFVGRLSPSKCQHDLIGALERYLEIDSAGRLLLVGKRADESSYQRFLLDETRRRGLTSKVLFLGEVEGPALAAFFRTAHLYWSMSEHEGFGVPLVESMWFDVPVLAYRTSAVPETLGPAGRQFLVKDDPDLAPLAASLVRDTPFRRETLRAQRFRREAFTPRRVLPTFFHLLGRLGVVGGPS